MATTGVIDVLREIRDLISNRGAEAPGQEQMPTSRRGVETPLVLANVSIKKADFRGKGPTFLSYGLIDSHHYSSGAIIIIVDSRKPAPLIFYFLEVRVTGWISNLPQILSVQAVSTSTGPMVVPFQTLPGATYDKITIDARQWINLAPSGADPGGNDARLTIQAEARLYR